MKRIGCLVLAFVAFAAVADEATLAKYKAAGQSAVAKLNGYSAQEIMFLTRARAREAHGLFSECLRIVGEASTDENLTDAEKAEVVFLVAEPAGAFVERLTDAFVDAKWQYRPLSDLVEQYGVVGGTARRVRDFFVRREVDPYRFSNRESAETQWQDVLIAPFQAGRALFDRVAQLIPSGLRHLVQWSPIQRFEGRWVLMPPPALPYFGADYARSRYTAAMGYELNQALEAAMKPEADDWAMASLLPIVDHVMRSEPVRLQWTNRSVRRWFFFMAFYFAIKPAELFSWDSGAANPGPGLDVVHRAEMGALEWSLIEVPLMLYLAHLRRIGTGINTFWNLEESFRRLGKPLARDPEWVEKVRKLFGAGLEKDPEAVEKAARCSALLAASGYQGETLAIEKHAGARKPRAAR